MSFEHTAKPGDRVIIVRRPKMASCFYQGYEIGDIGEVEYYESLCVRVKWLTNKGDHKERVHSILPSEYDVLPRDGGIVGNSIDYMMVDDVFETPPKTITGRKAAVLDRVRVTHLDPANEDDTFGIVVGDVGEVIAVFPTSIEVRWLTNLGEYNEDNGRPLRSFVLYHNEYEIIPYSEPLPT